MALSIKNSNTERLARELAAETGESITDAVEAALIERLERIRSRSEAEAIRLDVEDIVRRVKRLKIRDRRSAEEIIGYDEDGAPV